MTLARQLKAAARLDLGDVARSRWPLFALGAYALLASVLVLVGTRESAVLGFTGMSRVVLSFAHVLLLILPLLALAATVQVIARSREDGTIELLFSHPLSRTAYVLAVTATRYLALTAPLIAILFVMTLGAAIFAPGAAPWGMSLRAAAVSAALLWAFVGVGMAVSVGTRNQARAIVLGLTIWAASVAVLDLALVGVLLTWRVDALALFVLAASNPRPGGAARAPLRDRARPRHARPRRLLPLAARRLGRSARPRPRLAGAGRDRRLALGAAHLPARRPRLTHASTEREARA
ncbi:MAG: ABC transporter permease [Sandaracinaceae bacterium]|nr:ABC transporter permease [Sandaracinaceae bacterium]